MTVQILGTIWIFVTVTLATIAIVYYAIQGIKRERLLIELGKLREREDLLREEHQRLVRDYEVKR